MNELFNFQAYYSISTFVTLVASDIVTSIILGGVLMLHKNKQTREGVLQQRAKQLTSYRLVNQLISKRDMRILACAADILTKSDAHDELFYDLCAVVQGQTESVHGYELQLSPTISLVKVKEIAMHDTAVITEVIKS